MTAIKTSEDMRNELKRMAKRLRTTLTAIGNTVGTNSTVADYAFRSGTRRDVTAAKLFEFVAAAGHELVATPVNGGGDLGVTVLRSDDDLKRLIGQLPLMTGKALSQLTKDAGISLALVHWVHGTAQKAGEPQKTVRLAPVLKLFGQAGIELSLRKQGGPKSPRR